MTQLNDTTKRAEMQCSDINLGAVQKAEPHPRVLWATKSEGVGLIDRDLTKISNQYDPDPPT